jgi:hypothetical protein
LLWFIRVCSLSACLVGEVMKYQKKIMTLTAIHSRTVNRNFVNPLCSNNEVPPSRVVPMKQVSYPMMFNWTCQKNYLSSSIFRHLSTLPGQGSMSFYVAEDILFQLLHNICIKMLTIAVVVRLTTLHVFICSKSDRKLDC